MNQNFIQIEDRFTSGAYQKRDVCFVRGQDIILWDDQGNEYLDFASGISVSNIGHCHPQLVTAIREQAATLITAPELAYNNERAKLLEKLNQISPAGIDRFFLCNSGAEANEGCIKFAHLSTGRSKFVASVRGFHGRTIGALAATHNKKFREPFSALIPDFAHVPYNNVEKLESVLDESTAAVILELVQGEGGVRVVDSEYIRRARQLCDQYGCLLIIDEVQTGFGRTGKMFACEHFGVRPDLIAFGKAIAGGVPMGAIGIANTVSGLKPGLHGSTFGGNPLSCVAASAVIDILESEKLIANAAEMGQYFVDRLKSIECSQIRDIRHLGLMIGVELKSRVSPVLKLMMEQGCVVLNAGPTVVRFLPPLTVQKHHIDTVVERFTECLSQISSVSDSPAALTS